MAGRTCRSSSSNAQRDGDPTRHVRLLAAKAAWVRHPNVSNQHRGAVRGTRSDAAAAHALARHSSQLAIFYDISTAKDRWTTSGVGTQVTSPIPMALPGRSHSIRIGRLMMMGACRCRTDKWIHAL